MNFEEQIMSKDKYRNIYFRAKWIEASVCIIFQIVFAIHAVLKIGGMFSDIPQF